MYQLTNNIHIWKARQMCDAQGHSFYLASCGCGCKQAGKWCESFIAAQLDADRSQHYEFRLQ